MSSGGARRASPIARRESRVARRQRDVAARESELRFDDDERLQALVMGTSTRTGRARLRSAARGVTPAVVGLWVMASPLVLTLGAGNVAVAAVAAGAALGFLTMTGSHPARAGAAMPWLLRSIGTWLLGWATLGHPPPRARGRWQQAARPCGS